MLLLLSTAFGALFYAPMVTLMVLRLRAENRRLRAQNQQLRVEKEALGVENASLEGAFERRALMALKSNAMPAVPAVLVPAERLAYLFAFRRNVLGTPPGDA